MQARWPNSVVVLRTLGDDAHPRHTHNATEESLQSIAHQANRALLIQSARWPHLHVLDYAGLSEGRPDLQGVELDLLYASTLAITNMP